MKEQINIHEWNYDKEKQCNCPVPVKLENNLCGSCHGKIYEQVKAEKKK